MDVIPDISSGNLSGVSTSDWSNISLASPSFFTATLVTGLEAPNVMLEGSNGDTAGTASSNTRPGDTFVSSIDPASLCLVDSTSSSSSGASGLSPDSYLLPVNELTILRAVLRISHRIGCDQSFWQLEATSPFYAGTGPPTEQLPECWRPTPSQLLVPHHPFIDFLPWPSVRERMIAVLSLPPECRPPNASSPLALIEFAYDVEDSHEGMRIW